MAETSGGYRTARDLVFRYSEIAALASGLMRWRSAYRAGVTHGDWREILERPRLVTSEDQRLAALARQEAFLPAYRERVVNLVRMARRAGIEPILVTQPILWGRVTDPSTGAFLGDVRHRNQAEVDDVDSGTFHEIQERYNDVLRHVGRDEGVLVVDLSARLGSGSLRE